MNASRVKYIGIRYSLVPLVVGIVLGACQNQGEPTPGDGTFKGTMTLEYDWIRGFDVGSAYPEVRTAPDNALFPAQTKFLPERDEANALPYYVPNNSSSKFPSNNSTALRIYAKNNRHLINGKFLDYHFLSVNYSTENSPPIPRKLAAITFLMSGVYQHQNPVDERHSYVFWGDIQNSYNDPDNPLTPQDIKERAVAVPVHELGHQRYGLSEWDDSIYQDRHNRSQTWCVMRLGVTNIIPPEYRIAPKFCFSDDGDDFNSCIDWLKKAN